jgi:ABC-2 type transport system permease protein
MLHVAGFELRQLARRISTWVYLLLFGTLGFFYTAAEGGAWEWLDIGSPSLAVNSPVRVAWTVLTLGLFAVVVTAAMAGRAVQRDFETRAHPLFFTTPIRPWQYLGGRYLGAVAANLVVLLGIPLGIYAAVYSGLLEPGRVTPAGVAPALAALAWFAVPNVLFTAALLMMVGALTRRALAVHLTALGLLLGWSLSRMFIGALEFDWLTQLSDPFGAAALTWATRYWTVAEQNWLAVPVTGYLLLNRLLWLGVGAAAFAWGAARFRFAQFDEDRMRSRFPRPAPVRLPPRPVALRAGAGIRLPRVSLMPEGAVAAQLAAETRRAVLRVLDGTWFRILVGLTGLLVVLSASDVGAIYGTRTYPVTYLVLEEVGGAFLLLLVAVLTIYAGELVWEEREAGTAPLHDSLPVPTWVPLAAKTAALMLLGAVLLAVAAAFGMMIQAAHGYFRFEPGLYLRELFVHSWTSYALLCVLAMGVHTVANHKYAGHLAMLGYYVGSPLLYLAGVEHNLFHFAAVPEVAYSDMNGFGHVLAPWSWFTAFWAGVAMLIALASNLLRVRGGESALAVRVRLAGGRVTRPLLGATAVAAALVLTTGGFVVYNTTVLNDFETTKAGRRAQADYEKRYKRYEDAPQPRIAAVELRVDIHPARREVRVQGSYRLENRTGAAIDTIHVDLPNTLRIHALTLARAAEPAIADTALGYHAFRLEAPLAPGDTVTLHFDVAHETRGFTNEPSHWPVVENGTFFDNSLLPGIGYNPHGELTHEPSRTRHGLGERPRAAEIDDPRGVRRNFVARDADWIEFAATVGTSADQIALAPGYLTREWTEGGRRYFRYEMDAPMLNFYAFLSARYQVRRDRWEGVDIEVYHHPGHGYNVERMIRAVKRSLEYYTEQFGPYQHRQVRIVEFPRYREFAQSFDNTIPYSEGIGFIAHVRGGDIDYPFFVTAHEVAHQWWGHQVAPADVQGAGMVSETLAEYAALMVMEREFGREQIGRFLRYERDEYLKGRTAERRGEMPLWLAEEQPYIHYNKGALAMYALHDRMGEARLNGALRAFLDETRFRGPPYPTSRDLLRHLYAAAPDSLHGLVADLFEHVTLYDVAAVEARATALGGGRYAVEVDVDAWKLRADRHGVEEEVPMDEAVDVAVYGAGDRVLYRGRHRLADDLQTLRVEVEGVPRRAVIDPDHLLIDRDLEDNSVMVAVPRERALRGRPEVVEESGG